MQVGTALDGSVREDVGAVTARGEEGGQVDQPHVLSLVKWPGVRGAGRGLLRLFPNPASCTLLLIWGGGGQEEPGVALREEGASGGQCWALGA